MLWDKVTDGIALLGWLGAILVVVWALQLPQPEQPERPPLSLTQRTIIRYKTEGWQVATGQAGNILIVTAYNRRNGKPVKQLLCRRDGWIREERP